MQTNKTHILTINTLVQKDPLSHFFTFCSPKQDKSSTLVRPHPSKLVAITVMPINEVSDTSGIPNE